MTDSTLMNSLDEAFSRAERLVEEQGWDWYLAVQHYVNGPSPEEGDQSANWQALAPTNSNA